VSERHAGSGARPDGLLNLNARAWQNLRKAWAPPLTLRLGWQSGVVGPLFSGLDRLQQSVFRQPADWTPPSGCVVIVGYWRSGTTLLHNYLARDRRYGYPTTFECMNPHHFLFATRNDIAGPAIRRPMDDVIISSQSPQEDEFALLALGVRSPYEALLVPRNLPACLQLSDYERLSSAEQECWRLAFLQFLHNISLKADGRPLILKSPPHGNRIAVLRQLLPDARFILVARDPYAVFESNVRMWRSLFDLYAMTSLPAEDTIRQAILDDRPRYDAVLWKDVSKIGKNRFASIRYEELVASPRAVIEGVYGDLDLGDYSDVCGAIADQSELERHMVARSVRPREPWLTQVADRWRDAFERHGYPT
jgi:hypothetical protein